uniref:Uncharacterized protein n=1 Tax=Microcebus murinus TaxID=30608 RepID=A0A8C5XT91_MICMU
MTARILVLTMLLAISAQGDPDSAARPLPVAVFRVCGMGRSVSAPHDILAPLCLHQGALGEGQPQAPGPPRLRAPAAARGESPAPSPGPPPAARGAAERPDRWVTSGILPICTVLLTPSPACD